jgi:hypothetical protein
VLVHFVAAGVKRFPCPRRLWHAYKYRYPNTAPQTTDGVAYRAGKSDTPHLKQIHYPKLEHISAQRNFVERGSIWRVRRL